MAGAYTLTHLTGFTILNLLVRDDTVPDDRLHRALAREYMIDGDKYRYADVKEYRDMLRYYFDKAKTSGTLF